MAKLTQSQKKARKALAQKRAFESATKDYELNKIEFSKYAGAEVSKPLSERRPPLPRKSVSLRVPLPLYNELDYMALEKGVSRSELFLLALDAYFRRRV